MTESKVVKNRRGNEVRIGGVWYTIRTCRECYRTFPAKPLEHYCRAQCKRRRSGRNYYRAQSKKAKELRTAVVRPRICAYGPCGVTFHPERQTQRFHAKCCRVRARSASRASAPLAAAARDQ